MSLIDTISIMIVEDNDDKFKNIKKTLLGLKNIDKKIKLSIIRTQTYKEFTHRYESSHFDLVILDLSIPLDHHDNPSFSCASSILKSIKLSKHKKPFMIVGLTIYQENDYEKYFKEDYTFRIFNFREDYWIEYLKDNISVIHNGKSSLKHYFDRSYNMDVLLIVARKENEYDPIVKEVPWLKGYKESHITLENDDRYNSFGTILDSKGNELSFGIVCLGEMGLSTSASITTRLICDYRPRVLAMLGMCCGFNDPDMPHQAKLGDIIIAENTVCWDEGKYFSKSENKNDEPLFYTSPKIRGINNESAKKIEMFIEGNYTDLKSEIREYYNTHTDLPMIKTEMGTDLNLEPNIHMGMMVSGSSVIDSLNKVENIKSRFPNAIGLEMEAHSIYTATDCTLGALPKTIVIKGVADYGDGTKKKVMQKIASAGSLKTFLKLLECLYSET